MNGILQLTRWGRSTQKEPLQYITALCNGVARIFGEEGSTVIFAKPAILNTSKHTRAKTMRHDGDVIVPRRSMIGAWM